MVSCQAEQLDRLIGVAAKVFEPAELRQQGVVYNETPVEGSVKMLFAICDVRLVDRTQPMGGIGLCERKIVRDLQAFKGQGPARFVGMEPSAVDGQQDP